MVGGSLAGLEQQRGWHTESKVNWLVKQHRVASKASRSRVVMLRQAMGTVLVRAGERLVASPAVASRWKRPHRATRYNSLTSLDGWHSVEPWVSGLEYWCRQLRLGRNCWGRPLAPCGPTAVCDPT